MGSDNYSSSTSSSYSDSSRSDSRLYPPRRPRRARRRHRARRRPVVYLSKFRQDENPDSEHPPNDPAIIWKAKVCKNLHQDRESDLYLHKPYLTYVDDRPIEFSVSVPPTQPLLDAEKDSLEPVDWVGPVITVVEVDIEKERLPEIVASPRLDLLKPKHVSRRHLVVESPLLTEGLSDLIQYYPSFHKLLSGDLKEQAPMIEEPFAVLFHYFHTIEQTANKATRETTCKSEQDDNNTRTDQMKAHMQHLIGFLKPIHTRYIPACKKHLSEPIPRVTFDMIWYLLEPGTDVYAQLDGTTYAAVVTDVRRINGLASKVWGGSNEGLWLVHLWRLESNGIELRRGAFSIAVQAYTGLREVISLPVCPVSTWDAQDGGERRGQILRRSAIFFNALQKGNLLADYNGPIKRTDEYYTGKVVIDHRRGLADSYRNYLPSPPVKDYSDRFREYDSILVNNDRSIRTTKHARQYSRASAASITTASDGQGETRKWLETMKPPDTGTFDTEARESVVQQLTEHQLLLLCPEAFAYALRRKNWILISLDYVQESMPSNESISNLIIAQDELKTIQALSNRQNSKTRQWSADFIEGKGSGQIILLHGPPGVGKTYTVEAISEWLHRPLLALTVADIGTVETLVEAELLKWFDLAEAWNAVLLVDEADIFLERRQNRDLARNGLVSAFLRRMEYFKGLLFLTTNRVGQIDDAFISRVHVAIGYQALNNETRRKVWNGFFRKLVHEQAGKIQIASDAKKWVLDNTGETNLNGREIRNALQTAITLAEFEREEDPDNDTALVTVVTKTHFQKVLEMCNRFRGYIASIRREDEKKRAQGRGDRNDYDNEFPIEMV